LSSLSKKLARHCHTHCIHDRDLEKFFCFPFSPPLQQRKKKFFFCLQEKILNKKKEIDFKLWLESRTSTST
jgi:hypothetical protein